MLPAQRRKVREQLVINQELFSFQGLNGSFYVYRVAAVSNVSPLAR